jgi:hypothetical protein
LVSSGAFHPKTAGRLRAPITDSDAYQQTRGQRINARRKVVKAAGLVPTEWAPREMRHSFVLLLSTSGVALEDVTRLAGHSGTELVYRADPTGEGAGVLNTRSP